MTQVRDDVVNFLCYCPFVKGIHQSPGDSPKKASDTELWCFIWSVREQTVEQTIETPVIWDAIVFIMTRNNVNDYNTDHLS